MMLGNNGQFCFIYSRAGQVPVIMIYESSIKVLIVQCFIARLCSIYQFIKTHAA